MCISFCFIVLSLKLFEHFCICFFFNKQKVSILKKNICKIKLLIIFERNIYKCNHTFVFVHKKELFTHKQNNFLLSISCSMKKHQFTCKIYLSLIYPVFAHLSKSLDQYFWHCKKNYDCHFEINECFKHVTSTCYQFGGFLKMFYFE